jgi:non-specific serine/threonine protein kinase
MAMALINLGVIAERSGDLDAAATRLRRALAYCHASGNPSVLAQALFYLGRVVAEQGDLGQAAALLRESLLLTWDQGDLAGAQYVLVDLALLAAKAGHSEVGVRWLAAADTLLGDTGGFRDSGAVVARARSALSDAAFTAAWDAGTRLGWNDVLAESDALTAMASAGRPAKRRGADAHHGLSPREVDVLRLLAAGHANRAIGKTLSISERTVENHVLHILTKLGVESRTAAAALAIRQGLV